MTNGETPITLIGNLTSDPELRYTQTGVAVTSFTIAQTPRHFNRQTNEWKDGTTLFLRCSVWREQAEHVAASLAKGTRVIASGVLGSREWEDRETGEKRSGIEVNIDEIAPSLRYATASVTRAQSNRGADTGYTPAGQAGDSWATTAVPNDETPF